MANVIEIIIKGSNQAGAAFKTANAELASVEANAAAAAAAMQLYGLAIVGAAGAAVLAAKNFGDMVEQLENTSKRTGASINDIQVLQRAFTEQGLSADTATTALVFMSRAIARNDPLLKKFGITARDPHEAILQLSDAMASVTDVATLNEASFGLLGRSGSEAAVMLDGLRKVVKDLKEQMKELLLTKADEALGIQTDVVFDRSKRVLDGWLQTLQKGSAHALLMWQAILFPPSHRGLSVYPVEGIEVTADRVKNGPPGIDPGLLRGADLFTPAGGLRGSPSAMSSKGWMNTLSGEVTEPLQRLTEAGEKAAKALDTAAQSMSILESGVENSWRNMFMSLIGVQTQSKNIIVQLAIDTWNSVAASLSNTFGVSIGRALIGAVTGFFTGGPGGAAVGAAGGFGMPTPTTGPMNGMTVNISTLDARSLLLDLTSPSGGMRQANVRMREMARVN